MPPRERAGAGPGRLLGRIRKRKYLFAVAFASTYLARVNVTEHELVHAPRGHGGAAGRATREDGRIRLSTTSDPRAWTESYSPRRAMHPSVRIAFRLHDPDDVPYPDKFLSVKPYACSGPGKADLPPSLSPRAVLNFTVTIATDLRVVHLGDSLGQQFVQGFDASLLGPGREGRRRVLREYFYEGRVYSHNCLSVAAPVRGGGVSSYWRATDLLSRANHRREAACAREELAEKRTAGWSMGQPLELVGHRYSYGGDNDNGTDAAARATEEGAAFPVGPFDAVVMRIPHGWLDVADITRERIMEAIELSHETLGVRTAIVTTLPFNNNVLTAADWQGIHDINQMIRDIARTWKAEPGRGVRWVLVQEFGELANRILWENARHLGYAPAPGATPRRGDGWELAGTDFLLDRLPWAKRKWPPSVPMVCADRPAPGAKDCVRNRISADGMHWCVETLGPRYAASVACLLGCVHNGEEGDDDDRDEVRACEGECNRRLATTDPVDGGWIGGDAVLFARRADR